MTACHKIKVRAVCAAMLTAVLALPLCANAVQIDPADYQCSFNVRFPGYRGSTALADFPVLIRLSAALNDFSYGKCAADGADLRFADSNGNLIPHEIDTWEPNGVSLVWVKVPSLTKQTVVNGYYGYQGAGAPPVVTASDVWSNGYAGVWHMGAASSDETQADSTANGKTLSKESPSYGDGVLPGVAGKVGKAAEFGRRTDMKGGYIVDDSDDTLIGEKAVTIELWTYQDGVASSRMYLACKKTGAGGADERSYLFFQRESLSSPLTATMFYSVNSENAVINPSMWPDAGYTAPAVGQWNYNAVRYNGETGNLAQFVNDERIIHWTMGQYSNATLRRLGGGTFGLGNMGPTWSNAFPGIIDEARVSTVARSDDWLLATHDTISDSGFAVYGVPNDWKKYSHKFQVSFAGYEGNETLTDFPVLVKVSESGIPGFRYSDCLKPDGGDLRFSDESGNLLASEVDTWDVNGVSLVWVKVPSLTAATKITAYYGWTLAPGANSADVWSNGYLGVWHMGDDSRDGNGYAVMEDSSGGESPFTEDLNSAGSTVLAQAGVVGGSAEFVRTSSKVGMKNVSARVMLAGTSAATLELWAWQDDHEPSEASTPTYVLREVTTDGSTTPTVYQLYEAANSGNEGKIVLETMTSARKWTTPGGDKPLAARAEWNYHAATFDAEVGTKLLMNGALMASSSSVQGSLVERMTSSTLYLGNVTTGGNSSVWPGRIDEVRISGVVRSQDWVKATFDTIKNNATFTTYGTVRENFAGLLLIIR